MVVVNHGFKLIKCEVNLIYSTRRHQAQWMVSHLHGE